MEIHCRRLLTALLISLGVVCFLQISQSLAFEMDGEYRSIPTERGFELMDPAPIDSEYQSDLLTYAVSPHDLVSFSGQRHFYLSAGSLSATQFDFQLRAQIEEELNPGLIFKFLRTEHENYEEAVRSSVVELQSRLGESAFWLAAYGTLARLKKEDDVGFALLWRRPENEKQELRLFLTFADFTRSERNDTGDFFEGPGPMVLGAKWVRESSNVYRELLIRRESSIEWRDPNSSRSYTYGHQTVAGFMRRKNLSENWLSLRWQWDRKHTGLATLDTTGAVTGRDLVDRDRQQIELRRNHIVNDNWLLQFGGLWVARQWREENGRELFHQNLSPFLSVRNKKGIEIGVEATKFEALGDLSLGSATVRTEAVESRLNGRYHFEFENSASLSLALTFDIDRAEGGAFEGGHGKFQTSF